MVSILSDKHIQQSIYIALTVKNQCGRNSSSGGKGARKFTNTQGGSVTTFGIVKALDKICFKLIEGNNQVKINNKGN